MPDLSEFIEFIAEKSKIRKPSLIEKDGHNTSITLLL